MVEKTLTVYDDSDTLNQLLKMLLITTGVAFLATIIPVVQNVQTQTFAQAYQGMNDPRKVSANDTLKWLDLKSNPPYTLWVGAYFINDGPNPVEIAINFPDDKFTMNPGETVTISRAGAQERIAIIFYICKRGESASVRITGEY